MFIIYFKPMKKIILFAVILSFFAGISLNAQRISLESGSFDFLEGQEQLLVKFDYSDLSVGKFEKEEDYIAEKVEEYNNDEAGKGDQWKEAWLSDRPNRFEPKFEQLFNENIESKNLQCSRASDAAKYEVLVHTTFVEPGFNVGIARRSASIDVEMIFTEIATGNEMAVLSIKNCPGRDAFGFDFDTGYRIEEAYALLGKSVARYLLKRF